MSFTIKQLYKSDFGSFFHIKEVNRKKINNNYDKAHVKTGGFQEFVDIYLSIERKTEIIVESELLISRAWLKDKAQLIFALDIIKSFLNDFSEDKDFIFPLVDYLWQRGKGTLKEPNLIEGMNVILNQRQKVQFSSRENRYAFSNSTDEAGEEKLRIEIKHITNNIDENITTQSKTNLWSKLKSLWS